MKKILLVVCIAITGCLLFSNCTRSKCSDNANATISGYDMTKSLCGTGFIIKIQAQNNVPEKQYLVRELTGDYSAHIKIDSKFPIKVYIQNKFELIPECPNVIKSLEVSAPVVECRK